jgi:hypothetical protein
MRSGLGFEEFDALAPRDRSRPLDLDGNVIGQGVNLIELECGRGSVGYFIAEILGSHVVAALIRISEAIKVRHRRSRPATLYGRPNLVAGELRTAQGGRQSRRIHAAATIAGPAVTLRTLRIPRPYPLSLGNIALLSNRPPGEIRNNRKGNDRGKAGSHRPN